MKNIIKGWATTIIGLVIMAAAVLDFFGVLNIPAPDGVSKMTQISTAFLVGLALFLVPKSFLEEALKNLINKKTS